MGNIAFWLAALLLSIAAIMLIVHMLRKQNEPKSSTIDYLTIVLVTFIIFAGAFMAFTWLGEFQSGSQTGMLHSGANLFQSVLDKAAEEIKAPTGNPFAPKK